MGAIFCVIQSIVEETITMSYRMNEAMSMLFNSHSVALATEETRSFTLLVSAQKWASAVFENLVYSPKSS